MKFLKNLKLSNREEGGGGGGGGGEKWGSGFGLKLKRKRKISLEKVCYFPSLPLSENQEEIGRK